MLKKEKKQHCNTRFSKHSLQQDSTTCNTRVPAWVASSEEALEASTVMSSRAQEAQMFLVSTSYPSLCLSLKLSSAGSRLMWVGVLALRPDSPFLIVYSQAYHILTNLKWWEIFCYLSSSSF